MVGIMESITRLNIKQMQIYASAQQQHEILRPRGNSLELLFREHQSINNLMAPDVYTLV